MAWAPVVGWEKFYEVSTSGAVRSRTRTVVLRHPTGRLLPRTYAGRRLRLAQLRNGYLMVSFTAPRRKRRYAYVHDLVLAAFVGPKPRGKEVCHNDGIKTNNRIRNLRYGTRSENALDRHKHGTMLPRRGQEHKNAKLTDNDARWVREHADEFSNRAMARRLGVCHRTIGSIKNGEAWRHVNG